ncbi:TIGR03364 family FAD-dependent oxidoreductase [Microbacterium indicum]|uniref:TIGR03364 family FAD-dependent oxidoreductase n=1 Tax=Microbacterium indicum TaxID=358100 RepID=UPI0004255CD2|nr:TIGR03364 family FAD-dependent oxidoreductase [Microbacterium indicum]
MDHSYDVAVVGAGIVGLSHAAAAHRRGLRVIVIDRAPRLAGSTVRNFGHIGVSMQAGLGREYAERSRELYADLAQSAGFWLARRGSLMVATADDEMQVLRDAGQGRLLTAREITDLAPVKHAVGGVLLKDDMQVNPREAGPAIAAWLEREGVAFSWTTAALGARPGTLFTTRGEIRADNVVVCVNHDIDQLLPEVAADHGIARCALDMMLVDGIGLEFPVLTALSMLRYPAFAGEAADAVRARYEIARPEVLDLDVNQMCTEAPGLGLFVGDTHVVSDAASPFQNERPYEVLLREMRRLFGVEGVGVRQRWQGVYAKGPGEFLSETIDEGVHVSAVTTGIGMTTSPGFGEAVIADLYR